MASTRTKTLKHNQLIERDFLLLRSRKSDYRWVGISSDDMLYSAMIGDTPSEWPADSADLSRCIVTRRMSPEHLHGAMDVYLKLAQCRVAERHRRGVNEAYRMADINTPIVEQALKSFSISHELLPTPETWLSRAAASLRQAFA